MQVVRQLAHSVHRKAVHQNLSSISHLFRSPLAAEEFCVFNGVPYLVVNLGEDENEWVYPPTCPVIALGDPSNPHPHVDVLVESEEQISKVTSAIQKQPIASAVFVQLLRHNERASIDQALLAESLAFSTLQHGEEFLSWLHKRTRTVTPNTLDSPLVLAERKGETLELTLNRPEKHNAWSSEMRDALCESLALAIDDQSIRHVHLRGRGASFCSGGDLDEFGLARDAGIAHVSRTARSAGRLIEALRDSVTVYVQGACIGAGIEVPAFATTIISSPDAYFRLPEVQMGLVPGAGGTASILRRVGKHRLAWMGLTGQQISAREAQSWGLVDQICD